MQTKNDSRSLAPLLDADGDQTAKLTEPRDEAERRLFDSVTQRWLDVDARARGLTQVAVCVYEPTCSEFFGEAGPEIEYVDRVVNDHWFVLPDEFVGKPCFHRLESGEEVYLKRIENFGRPASEAHIRLCEIVFESASAVTGGLNAEPVWIPDVANTIELFWNSVDPNILRGEKLEVGAVIIAISQAGFLIGPSSEIAPSGEPVAYLNFDWLKNPENWAQIDATRERTETKSPEKKIETEISDRSAEKIDSIANPPQATLTVTSLPISATEKINGNEIENSDDGSDGYFATERTVTERTKAIKKIAWQELQKFTATPSPARKSRIARANPKIAAFIAQVLKRTPCANQFKTMGLRQWALVLMATLQIPLSTDDVESAAESLGLIDGVRLKIPKGWANAHALESAVEKIRRELASK